MAQKFKIGQIVKLSAKALERTKQKALCLNGTYQPELDPITQFATGIVTDYNGGYDVTWDNDDGIYIDGLYSAWWPAEDLAACTADERRKMSNQFLREKRIRREQAEQRKQLALLEIQRDKELKNGFSDKEYISKAYWLYDHEKTADDLYVDAYYLLNADLPEELLMKDGVCIDFPADLRVLHKIRIRARSLRMAWGSNGFRKGFNVQYIFETDKPSAASNTKRFYRGGNDGIGFILPDEDGDWHFTYMKHSGQAQWASTAVEMLFQCSYPDIAIEEPQGGFDTLLQFVKFV